MDYLERITSQLEQFIANAPTNPEVHRAVGAFALYVLAFYAVALSWKAVRAPVMGAWWTARVGWWGGLFAAAQALRATVWFAKGPWRVWRIISHREPSALAQTISAALGSNRLRYRTAGFGTTNEGVYIGENELAHNLDFAAWFKDGSRTPHFVVHGQGVDQLLSTREYKALTRQTLASMKAIATGENMARRDLLTEHLARVLAPANDPIATRWGKVPTETRGGLETNNGRNRTVAVGSSDFV